MNTADVMQEYNEFERKRIHSFSGVSKSDSNLTKFVSEHRHGSYISFFDFDESLTTSIVKEQIEYFSARNLNFEWKTYSTDTPSNIGKVLLDSGFEQEESESFMVLALSKSTNTTFDESHIKEVSDSQGIGDAIRVQEQVWGGDLDWQYAYLMKLKEQSPESVSIYVVYVNGQPVTSAWLTFNGDSPFASIWGGSTIKAFRGNGYYSLLLNKRISEAKARGIQYLTIDASDMSKPIVSKHGFKVVATTTGYSSPNGSQSSE
ncbi:GNAT family N-acetyltransferase [Vibrio ostreicida]|uniref:GNAT family N-acetyltransferase n=1 Tax=Vibrio ostreicida TaxID=526588 RepID=UPI0009708597|nr:GNAT family N-acetyltransferase [Vibrio ostreicida]